MTTHSGLSIKALARFARSRMKSYLQHPIHPAVASPLCFASAVRDSGLHTSPSKLALHLKAQAHHHKSGLRPRQVRLFKSDPSSLRRRILLSVGPTTQWSDLAHVSQAHRRNTTLCPVIPASIATTKRSHSDLP
jgi:hypothetical protein